jgi:hypothetical protein
VEQPFADIEVVHAAGEGVQPDDAVHAIGTDCVVGNTTKMRDLVAVPECCARYVNPCCVGGRDAERVYADGGEEIDGAGVDEGLVAAFEYRAAAATEELAEGPFCSVSVSR